MPRNRVGYAVSALCLSLSVVAPVFAGGMSAGTVPPPKEETEGKFSIIDRMKLEEQRNGPQESPLDRYIRQNEERLANPFFGGDVPSSDAKSWGFGRR
jgi:hypothetical protein